MPGRNGVACGRLRARAGGRTCRAAGCGRKKEPGCGSDRRNRFPACRAVAVPDQSCGCRPFYRRFGAGFGGAAARGGGGPGIRAGLHADPAGNRRRNAAGPCRRTAWTGAAVRACATAASVAGGAGRWCGAARTCRTGGERPVGNRSGGRRGSARGCAARTRRTGAAWTLNRGTVSFQLVETSTSGLGAASWRGYKPGAFTTRNGPGGKLPQAAGGSTTNGRAGPDTHDGDTAPRLPPDRG